MGKEKFNIYPLTIICDRYSGVYSGGRYTAWNCEAYELPDEIDDCESRCAGFWATHATDAIGRGNTPNEALEDLYSQLTAANCPVIRTPQWRYFRVSKLTPMISGAMGSINTKAEFIVGISEYTMTACSNSHDAHEERYAIIFDSKYGYSIFDTMVKATDRVYDDVATAISQMTGLSISGSETVEI